MTAAAYDELTRHWTRLHRFGHLQSIAGWDRAAMMPTKGNEARSLALAEMDGLLHRLRTEPRLVELLASAERDSLDDFQRANLREGPARLARLECRARIAGGSEVARHVALRARLADAASGRRLGRLRRQPARGAAPDARRSEVPGRRHRPVAVRGVDGPVRAGRDHRPGRSPVRRPAGLAARPRAPRAGEAGERGGVVGTRPVSEGTAACAEPRRDAPARLRLRRRPSRRERASLQRRRARRHAPDHALSRRRFRDEPDGHHPRNRPRALRAEPAARLARPADRAGALDGRARKPEPVVRDATRPQRSIRRPAGAAPAETFGCAAGVRGGQSVSPAHTRRAGVHSRLRR